MPRYELAPRFAPEVTGAPEPNVPEEISPPMNPAVQAPMAATAAQVPDVFDSPMPPEASESAEPAGPASEATTAEPMQVTPPAAETDPQASLRGRTPSSRYRSVRVTPRTEIDQQAVWQTARIVQQQKPDWRPTRRR